ncbi:amidohydrolase family protein [Paenibacillus glycanilyticus]|uniref:Deaminase n=1 Tax=Paenibacillus glycanilyticus TaxID=126569 RepID=A0ABQ6GL09_9BACL|nr:amidohydrolase family protein [Paenibacillus glycanilyticus]GLX70925.1 deaminase [Paenibacillus glycanilyticus]
MVAKTILKNVQIEGSLFDLTLDLMTGCIADIVSSDQTRNAEVDLAQLWDAEGLQYLPALSDMHVHLDKHFLGEPWKPLQPFITLPGQLAFEKQMLESLPTRAAERAHRLLQLLLMNGTTAIRTHVDVDPKIGLSHLEDVLEVREHFKGRMDIEIVAFPQQGLLRSQSMPIMKEALRAGADLVGGVDPAGLDGQVDASLNAMFELSAEFNAGVDLHLHDPGQLGIYTINRFADLTGEAGNSGRTAVSHAYCLGQVSEAETRLLAQKLRDNGVSIMTSVPIDRPMPPVDLLLEEGVRVQVGSDNILDSWSPFGNGDLLARGSRLAEKFGWITDDALLRTYPLLSSASLVPKAGDRASFSLARALNAQHAIAAAPPREAVFSGGMLVGGCWLRGSRKDQVVLA